MDKEKYTTVESYIASCSADDQAILRRIRNSLKKVLPATAEEVISYQMPAFRQHRVFLYYAAFKDHYSLFIPPSDIFTRYEKELAPYHIHKATIQFKKTEPIPYELIEKLAKAAVEADAKLI